MSLAIHDSIKFLEEAAEYFEKRPTGGEDRAYWANVYNAEHCRRIIEEIEQARTTSQYWKSEHIEANAEIDRLRNIISAARECLDADDVIGAIEILERNND